MDKETAERAVVFTEDFLRFKPKLSKYQRAEWVSKAMGATRKEWNDAVTLHYNMRLRDFQPTPHAIFSLIPGKDKPDEPKNTLDFPTGWVEDPNKSFQENYKAMIDARYDEKKINI